MVKNTLKIRIFSNDDSESVVALWNRCGLVVPWNDPLRDIERKSMVQKDIFMVGLVDDQIVASIMGGYDGHRGWLNYLAVDPDHRCRGYGSALVAEAETRLESLGCPKVNLQVRNGNSEVISFYKRLGYGVDEVICLGKRIGGNN